MSGLSEGELHVQAMRLVCEALQDREQDGLEVDWDVLRQMHDQMDAMLQALQHKHRYDSSEIVDLRKDRDAARSEIETLKGAMAADDQRLRDAEEEVWPGVTWGCDAPDKMADEILILRTMLVDSRVANINLQGQLDAARAETVETRKRLNNETDLHRATNSEKIELFQQKESANQHNAELVKERDAARETILAQKRGIQYLRLLIDKVRGIVCRDDAMSERLEQISQALDEFDHGTIEPTPSPEVERLRAFVGKVRAARDEHNGLDRDARVEAALAELDAGTEATPVAEPIDAEGGQ